MDKRRDRNMLDTATLPTRYGTRIVLSRCQLNPIQQEYRSKTQQKEAFPLCRYEIVFVPKSVEPPRTYQPEQTYACRLSGDSNDQ